MMTAMIVLASILMLVQVAVKNADRTAERVAADQRGRPAMNKILDRLHASCVAPLMTPVKEGSDDDTLILLSKAGSAAILTPNRYVIGLNGTALTETVYRADRRGTAGMDLRVDADLDDDDRRRRRSGRGRRTAADRADLPLLRL